MKNFFLSMLLVVGASVVMNAQHMHDGTSVKYPHFELSAFPQPTLAAAPGQPLLVGRTEKGKKDQFGIQFGAAAGSLPVVEFLDAGNKVIKALTINDLLGKGTGVKLLRSMTDALGSRSEAVYEIPFGHDTNELAIRALALADDGEKGQKILLSLTMKDDVPGLAAIRVVLPVDGQASVQENGFIIASKTQAASFSAAVYPKPQTLVIEKNALVIQCGVSSISTRQSESPLMWLIAEGAGPKSESAAAMKKNSKYTSEPNLVIITTANKEHTQSADTVMYSVVCTNIGLGHATEVVLSNPIPAGTTFVEGSAVGSGTEITVDRTKATGVQRGAAALVRWKLKEALQPGAEKVVSFKVIVQ